MFQDYLLDAPVSIGDGFSFSGGQISELLCFPLKSRILIYSSQMVCVFFFVWTGKYSDEPSPADEWFKQGKFVGYFVLLLRKKIKYLMCAPSIY